MCSLSARKVKVFIESVEAGSFTEGARRSNISQPAAINIINEIEEFAGKELFLRNGKSRCAKLTSFGEEVYDTLVQAVSVYSSALDQISRKSRKRVPQAVLIQTPYASAISSEWLSNLLSSQDDRQLSICSADWDQIMTAIRNRDDCIALVEGNSRPATCEYFSVGATEVVFAVSTDSKYTQFLNQRIAWADVPRETLLYSAVSPETVSQIYQNLGTTGAAKSDFTEVKCASLAQSLVDRIKVPIILPKITAEVFRNAGKLRYVEFSHSKIHIQLGLSVPFGYRVRMAGNGRQRIQVLQNEYLTQ